VVRKTFHGNLDRARRNIDKQRRFPIISADGLTVRAAPVESFVVAADSAVLTMPYIEGHVGEDIALYGGFALSRQLRAALSEVVYRQMAASSLEQRPLALFTSKLDEVIARTTSDVLQRELGRVHDRLRGLPRRLDFPIGRCHGDLTLSNVILSPGQNVVLIDFLDTYLETPLQDVAKLMQDFEYGWSFRNSPPELKVRGEVFLRESYPVAVHQFAAMYPLQTGLLSVMCLARIAPYVGDETTESWLAASLRLALRPGTAPGFAGPTRTHPATAMGNRRHPSRKP
jgi:hypothetical protein